MLPNVSSADVLGKVYGVVAKLRGRIVAVDLKEGTTFFTVRALLPVVESFGFSDGECKDYACPSWASLKLSIQKSARVRPARRARSLSLAGTSAIQVSPKRWY